MSEKSGNPLGKKLKNVVRNEKIEFHSDFQGGKFEVKIKKPAVIFAIYFSRFLTIMNI